MDLMILAIHPDKLCSEASANFREQRSKSVDNEGIPEFLSGTA